MKCPYCGALYFHMRVVYVTDETLYVYEVQCSDCGRYWHVTIPDDAVLMTRTPKR